MATLPLPVDRPALGTHYLPGAAWPAGYGALEDEPPPGFTAQLWWPFSRRR